MTATVVSSTADGIDAGDTANLNAGSTRTEGQGLVGGTNQLADLLASPVASGKTQVTKITFTPRAADNSVLTEDAVSVEVSLTAD